MKVYKNIVKKLKNQYGTKVGLEENGEESGKNTQMEENWENSVEYNKNIKMYGVKCAIDKTKSLFKTHIFKKQK